MQVHVDFAYRLKLDFWFPSNCNIADKNSRCCTCRECNETYAKRSKLARHLNVYDGVIQDIMLNSATHGQKAMIYYIVMM